MARSDERADAVAASGALTAHCARVLRETRDPDAAAAALGAMLALVDASFTPPPPPPSAEEAQKTAALAHDTLLQPRASLMHAFVRHHYARWAATMLDADEGRSRAAKREQHAEAAE